MTGDPTSPGASSTSPTRPSPSSPRFPRGRSTSASPGSGLLTRRALRELAERHGVRPRKSLGQHFLADPNLARAIAREAGAGPGERVLEVGAGLGSLTLAMVQAGAHVLAVELDRALIPPLQEVVGWTARARVARLDAARATWSEVLEPGPWRMASNLPYNVAVPVVMGLLESAPDVDPMLVMVQREVGERMAAGPGDEQYGAVSVRIAYRAEARVVRRVPPSVFWPEPNVDSVLVRLERRPPPVDADPETLFRLIEEGFAQRRKQLAGALVRLGVDRRRATSLLEELGMDPKVRAEALGLEELGRLAEAIGG